MSHPLLNLRDGPVARLRLNRPELHNAFDATLIAALTGALDAVAHDDSVRVVILESEGASFSAGADLNWMKRMAGFSKDENQRDAMQLAALMRTLNNLRKPTIARVHGAAYGGGVGLVACCDIAMASHGATFALSEARLGLVPAVVSPYVVAAIGERAARRYFATGERFDAGEAWRLGLVHDVDATDEAMDNRLGSLVQAMLACGPVAQREAKELVRAVAGRPVSSELIQDTAERIARIRSSPEGREGVAAFLEKRRASWVPPPEPAATPDGISPPKPAARKAQP
jgi:methylglutaconyl-CoA hydratase